MNSPRVAGEDDEQLWLEAIEWHALRCGEAGLTPAQCTAWRLWWQDTENRRIYAACARLHADAQRFDLDHEPAETYPTRGRQVRKGRDGRTGRRVLIGAVLAAVVAGGMIRMSQRQQNHPPVPAAATSEARIVYQTGPGQTGRVRLSDGSSVTLGAETTLDVSLTPRRRRVSLKRGEAWFQVVHRRHWPFIVTAGNGTITDLGTAFVVDREVNRVEVTVTQGLVEVAVDNARRVQHPQHSRVRPIRLRRGEQFSYGQDAGNVVRTVDPRRALSWTTGILEFSDEPLRVVVENVARYMRRPLEVSPAAGRLRLTTLVQSRRIPAWLDGLSRVLPVTVAKSNVAICIRLHVSQTTHLNNTCRQR